MAQKYTFQDTSKSIEERAQSLLALLTPEEKAAQLAYQNPGIPRLGIPPYSWWNEALHGVARAGAATVFPQAIGMAATFSPEMLKWMGCVVALEGRIKHYYARKRGDYATYKGLNFFAPNINIFRDPRWGRGQETYGECPFLSGVLGTAFVQGVQDRIGEGGALAAVATPKHFAVHSGPESCRLSFDAQVSRKDLFETYLAAFRRCVVKGKAKSVMSAYNAVDGKPCSVNAWLLKDVLRQQWGFEGTVVTDAGCAQFLVSEHHCAADLAEAYAAELKAGVDVMTDGRNGGPEALQRGLIDAADLDRAVLNQLRIKLELGLLDPLENDPAAELPFETIECDFHRKLALDAARKGIVLLKNNGILPLQKERLETLAVIGPNADEISVLLGNYHGTPSHKVTLLAGIQNECGKNVRVFAARGCDHLKRTSEGCGGVNDCLAEALEAAEAADAVVLCLGLTPHIEGEQIQGGGPESAGDREAIEYPDVQLELLQRLYTLKKPLVLVNVSGSAVAIPERYADAVVQCFYPGAEGGTALAEILFGKVNPSGRLPVTFYRATADLPDFRDYGMAGRTYRFCHGPVLYPFGYGLSYTTFKYSDFKVLETKANRDTTVEVRVTNKGPLSGEEVVQVYVKLNYPQAPLKQLCGIKRVSLKPGEVKTVKLVIEGEMFDGYDAQGVEFPVTGEAVLMCDKLKKSVVLTETHG